MAKLGILASAGVSGDLPPVMAMALGLVGRGHYVTFLAGRELASIAEGAGLGTTITDRSMTWAHKSCARWERRKAWTLGSRES